MDALEPPRTEHHDGALAARQRLLGGCALPFWMFCGATGLLLTYLWGFSEHQAAWANRNLLLLSPLALLLLPGAWSLLRGRQPRTWFRVVLWLMTGIALLALPLATLSHDRTSLKAALERIGQCVPG